MTKHWLGRVVWMASAAVAGCGSPVSTYLGQQEAFADDVCSSCPQAVGEDSELSCRAELESGVTATEEACLERVYSENSDELAPILNCQNDLIGDFRACVHTAISTCPPLSSDLDLCADRADTAAARCGTPSDATADAFDACSAD